jgi:hypothetical protein
MVHISDSVKQVVNEFFNSNFSMKIQLIFLLNSAY